MNLRAPLAGLLVACVACGSVVKPGALHAGDYGHGAHYAQTHLPPHHQHHVPDGVYDTTALRTPVAAVASTSPLSAWSSSVPSLYVPPRSSTG